MTTTPRETKRALSSENGTTWQQSGPVGESAWPVKPDTSVVKLVLGRLGDAEEGDDWTQVLPMLESGLKERFPALTHLHLWGLPLTDLGPLPEKLQCLDIRKCPSLRTLSDLPTDWLDTLVLSDCPKLHQIPDPGALSLLYDLDISNSGAIEEQWILAAVDASGEKLRKVNLSGSELLTELVAVPSGVVDLRLSRCTELVFVPESWHPALRRLELDGCVKLDKIPPFPEPLLVNEIYQGGIDYLNLANTPSLRSPLVLPRKHLPRTLFLFGSGIPIDPSLKGTVPESNVARDVAADFAGNGEAEGRIADHEVKLILLGNGRCGKTSLARQLTGGGEFDPHEKSTHGVKLWETEFDFEPLDGVGGSTSKAKVNIWDFAGQDLYHSTHRIFLQNRAIYVICESDHGGGSCLADDPDEEDPFDEEGFRRPREYWESQIASLERVGGVELQDLIIRVKTKFDRGSDGRGVGLISVSAKKGTGLRQLGLEIRKRIALLLGQWQERSLPAEAMSVKERLRNIAAGKETLDDGTDRRRMATGEAMNLFRTTIPEGPYHDEPLLLLRRFHRSGFLFHDEQSFPGWVILDQRWALDGIYAIMSRESAGNVREKLLVRHGAFTPSQLRTWVWDSLGYTLPDQKLFIGLMQSCGTCFELLREDESRSGEAVYVATGFLPVRGEYEEWIHELVARETGKFWSEVTIPMVAESEIQGLVAWAGEHWGRSAKLWRWGAMLKVRESGAVVLVDWKRKVDDDYTGEVEFRFFGGRDGRMEGELREKTRNLFRHPENQKQGVFDELWREPDRSADLKQIDLSIESAPHAVDRTVVGGIKEDRQRRNGVKVTFSLAGGLGNQEIPLRLVNLLKEHFETQGLGADDSVLCYLPLEGEERLAEFTKQLAKGDLILVFWSRKYFFSQYCMPEMMWIYQEEPEGRLLDKRVRIYSLDGESMAMSDAKRPNVISASKWKKYWCDWVNKRAAQARKAGGRTHLGERQELRRNPNLLEWHDFLGAGDEVVEPFIRTLCNYRLAMQILREGDVESKAAELFQEVLQLLDEPLQMLEVAKSCFASGQVEKAVLLLQQFYSLAGDTGSNFFERLERQGNQAIPQDLIQAARDYLRRDIDGLG